MTHPQRILHFVIEHNPTEKKLEIVDMEMLVFPGSKLVTRKANIRNEAISTSGGHYNGTGLNRTDNMCVGEDGASWRC